MNRLTLSAAIAQIGSLRTTPAGLPALDFELEHASTATQAGQSRDVKLRIKATAVGAVAERVAARPLGSRWRWSGFLANRRGGTQAYFHIDEFVPESND